eukprot:jgi/Hompol1/5346/HPOL_004350-RA
MTRTAVVRPETPVRSAPPTPGTPGRQAIAAANPDDVRRSFDEWMKIAADNNISPANTWNLALIDYFYDMSVLRDGASINFQKASCTLDGCVKIYTSRVDSVDSETKRLLDSLIERSSGSTASFRNDDDPDEAPSKRSRAKHRAATKTLEEDISQLNWKQFESEFAVDPLFKKTASEFDEGGAQGLLLNHLNIDLEGRVLFDAGAVKMLSKSDATDQKGFSLTSNDDDDIPDAEFEKLMGKFGNNLDKLDTLSICPTFKEFRFDGSAFDVPMTLPEQHREDPTDYHLDDDDNYDPFQGGDFADDGDDGMDIDNHDISSAEINVAALLDQSIVVDANGDNLGANASVRGDEDDDSKAIDSMFSYFDANMLRQWAGPEYWRGRSTRAKKVEGSKLVASTVAASASTLKKPRQPAHIDFITGDPVDRSSILAPSTKSSLLPKQSRRVASKHLLPVDLHITSKTFVKYFLKPDMNIVGDKAIRSVGNGSSPQRQSKSILDRQIDTLDQMQDQDRQSGAVHDNTHAMADDAALFDDADGGFYDDYDDYDSFQGGNPGDLSVQPDHDPSRVGDDSNGGTSHQPGEHDQVVNDFKPHHHDSGDGDAHGNFDVDAVPASPGGAETVVDFAAHLARTSMGQVGKGARLSSTYQHHQQPTLTFARSAKRVDVKRLKDNIWRSIEIQEEEDRLRHRASVSESCATASPVKPVDRNPFTEKPRNSLSENTSGSTTL